MKASLMVHEKDQKVGEKFVSYIFVKNIIA